MGCDGLVDGFWDVEVLIRRCLLSVVVNFKYYPNPGSTGEVSFRTSPLREGSEEGDFSAGGKLPSLGLRSRGGWRSRSKSSLNMRTYYWIYIAMRDDHCCLWKSISCSAPSCANCHSQTVDESSLHFSWRRPGTTCCSRLLLSKGSLLLQGLHGITKCWLLEF